MNENERNKMIEGAAIGAGLVLLALLFFYLYNPQALFSTSTSLISNSQTLQVQAYKYVNVSDLRVNNKYFYPNNCINYKTEYTQNNATTPAYISSVIIGNDSVSEAYISVPYIINGSVYEFHYIIYCK